MSQHPNASEETAAAQRREALETRPQDRFAGRGKFTGCHECGTNFGMYRVWREAIGALRLETIETLSWYITEEANSDLYLYTPCIFCNPQMRMSSDFKPLGTAEVVDWYLCNPHPDYAAPAAEEPVLASEDSRESARLEG